MERLARKDAFSLAIDAYYNRSTNEKYSAEERQEGLKQYLADLGKDYRNNKNEIFQIIEDTANEILPAKVLEQVRQFAEFRNFDENTTVKFKVKRGKIKAVSVALGGSVRRCRVDQGSFTIRTEAIQCKVYEEFERIIAGLTNWTELINMVIDAIMENILRKIYACLIDLVNKVPSVNVHTETSGQSFDEEAFKKIINIVKCYGSPVILGTPSALSQIPLNSSNLQQDLLDIRNKGILGVYRGIPIVELPNSFEDKDNLVPVFDDNYIFVIPQGQEKMIKVAMEGGLHTRDAQNADWSYEFESYQKVGVGIYEVNNIGIYKMA